eukprot:159176_1
MIKSLFYHHCRRASRKFNGTSGKCAVPTSTVTWPRRSLSQVHTQEKPLDVSGRAEDASQISQNAIEHSKKVLRHKLLILRSSVENSFQHKFELAETLHHLGRFIGASGDFETAEGHLNESLEIFGVDLLPEVDSRNPKPLESPLNDADKRVYVRASQCLLTTAKMFQLSGKLTDAEKIFIKCHELLKRTFGARSSNSAHLSAELGELYGAMGPEYSDKCQSFLIDAVTTFDMLGDKRGITTLEKLMDFSAKNAQTPKDRKLITGLKKFMQQAARKEFPESDQLPKDSGDFKTSLLEKLWDSDHQERVRSAQGGVTKSQLHDEIGDTIRKGSAESKNEEGK